MQPTPRRKSGGPWCKKLDKALRSGVRPIPRQPLPTDVMRIVVDMLIREDKTLAYDLGLVSKSFRTWVLQILYEVVIFTSPAHVEQVKLVSTLAGSLTMHVRHVSLAGLEMHIYGGLDREEGLYKVLQRFLSACETLETILYDFKRVSLPFLAAGPRSLTQAHWSHSSRDGWRGYEPVLQYVTHLRIDCAQNDARNAATFAALLSPNPRIFPALTHLAFGVDARFRTHETRATVDFVRCIFQRPEIVVVIVMVWHYEPQYAFMGMMLEAYADLHDPRVCFFLSSGAPDDLSASTDWKHVAGNKRNRWNDAERLLSVRRDRSLEVDTRHELTIGSIVHPTLQPLPHVAGYVQVV